MKKRSLSARAKLGQNRPALHCSTFTPSRVIGLSISETRPTSQELDFGAVTRARMSLLKNSHFKYRERESYFRCLIHRKFDGHLKMLKAIPKPFPKSLATRRNSIIPWRATLLVVVPFASYKTAFDVNPSFLEHSVCLQHPGLGTQQRYLQLQEFSDPGPEALSIAKDRTLGKKMEGQVIAMNKSTDMYLYFRISNVRNLGAYQSTKLRITANCFPVKPVTLLSIQK